MAKYTSPEQLIAAATEILPAIRAGAEASETARRICEPILEALFERRLFRLFIPRELDGEEIDLIAALRVFELLSTGDGATGWTVMIGAGAGLFAGFLDPATAREIFLPERAVVAGSGAATGTARQRETGYQVSGRWAYASGAHHATWFTANCVVEDGAGCTSGDGPGQIRAVAVPAADVEVRDSWSVTGMRGTGSQDFEIVDRFVPASHTFSISDAPNASGPLYRFPFRALAELSFASVSLGIARHALDEFQELATRKRPAGTSQALVEDADVQTRVGRAEAIVGSSRAYLYDAAEQAWRDVVRGDLLSEREQARLQLAAVDAVQRCANAVDLLYRRAGMTPLFASSPFGRAWRDVHAVTQNAVVSAGLYSAVGRALLGGRHQRQYRASGH